MDINTFILFLFIVLKKKTNDDPSIVIKKENKPPKNAKNVGQKQFINSNILSPL